MVILAHYKYKNFNRFVRELITIKDKYSSNEFGVENDLFALLERCEQFFKELGKCSEESKISTLRAYLATAKTGVDPKTLEVIKSHKRNVVKTATFYCLSEMSSIIEEAFEEVTNLLRDAEKTLGQIVISIIQSGGYARNQIEHLQEVEEIADFWKALVRENQQINLVEAQLKQNLLREDIYLLLHNIINNIKSK